MITFRVGRTAPIPQELHLAEGSSPVTPVIDGKVYRIHVTGRSGTTRTKDTAGDGDLPGAFTVEAGGEGFVIAAFVPGNRDVFSADQSPYRVTFENVTDGYAFPEGEAVKDYLWYFKEL